MKLLADFLLSRLDVHCVGSFCDPSPRGSSLSGFSASHREHHEPLAETPETDYQHHHPSNSDSNLPSDGGKTRSRNLTNALRRIPRSTSRPIQAPPWKYASLWSPQRKGLLLSLELRYEVQGCVYPQEAVSASPSAVEMERSWVADWMHSRCKFMVSSGNFFYSSRCCA